MKCQIQISIIKDITKVGAIFLFNLPINFDIIKAIIIMVVACMQTEG
ncbi:MAG: hypothetical protein M0R48_06280 [Candidatus Omnitrophica bacterium]|nr:hypothetical protein [Candidatus Omnitrophota bacterium]